MPSNQRRKDGNRNGQNIKGNQPPKKNPDQKKVPVATATSANGLPVCSTSPLPEHKAMNSPSARFAAHAGENWLGGERISPSENQGGVDVQHDKQTLLSEGQGRENTRIQAVEESGGGHQPHKSMCSGSKTVEVVTKSVRSLGTNVIPLITKSKLSLYEISSNPKAHLTKGEQRWLVEGFREQMGIEPCLGSLILLDNRHFLTFNHSESFDGRIHHGTIDRQEYRPGKNYKRIYIGNEPGRKLWSSLEMLPRKNEIGSNLSDDGSSSDGSSVVSVNSGAFGTATGSFKVYASCRAISHVDFTDVNGTVPTNERFASALEHCYLPKTPTMAINNPFIVEHLVFHGNKTFDFTTKGQSIGFGLERRAGIISAIRPSSDGLIDIVTPCQRVFYAPMKLSTFISMHKPDFAIDSAQHIEALNVVLRGLRVKVKKANGGEKFATIRVVTSTCPSDTFFCLADNGTQISVEEYFAQKRNIVLTGMDQPCIDIGTTRRPQYFPTGVCQILPGQSFGKRLPRHAQVCFEKLQNRKSHHENNPHLEQIKGCHSNEEELLKWRVQLLNKASTWRGLPKVHDVYSNGRSKIEPLRLSLGPDLINNPGTSFTNGPFSLYIAQVGNGPSLSGSFQAFISILYKKARGFGVSEVWPSDTAILKLSDTEDHWRRSMENMKSDSSARDLTPMLLVALDRGKSNKQAYKKVKSSFALEHGFQSTCISILTLEKAHSNDNDNGLDKYVHALLRKVLVKAQAHSSTVVDAIRKTRSMSSQKKETLFVGIHVAHLALPKTSTTKKGNPSCRTSAVTIATKFCGEDGPYKVSTELLSASQIGKNGLPKVLSNHLEKLQIGARKSSVPQILLFRSGASQTTAPEPVKLNGFKLQTVQDDGTPKSEISLSITSQEAEQFRSYCKNELQGASGVYIAVEKPAKIELYNEEGSRLKGNASEETEKCERVAWVIQPGTTDSAHREFFIMKELKGTNRHYPLRVRIHSVNGSIESTALQNLVRRIRLLDAWNGTF